MSGFGHNRSLERFQTHERLGNGSYGQVYRARDTQTQSDIAMKKMNLNLETEGVPTTVIREVSLLRELNHPNIVKFHDIIVTENRLFLIFELLEKDLRKLMEEVPAGIDENAIKRIIFQTLKALNFCHARRFMHRDLKPENILLDRNSDVKVADFGLARAFQIPGKPYTNEVQTLWYRAPEVLLGVENYSVAIDIWSVGCIFAELVLRRPLFTGSSPFAQLIDIFKVMGTPTEETWPGVTTLNNFPSTHESYPPCNLQNILSRLGSDGLDLLGKMLCMNPANRIAAKFALMHPYFEGLE